jgi:hypothetical protein
MSAPPEELIDRAAAVMAELLQAAAAREPLVDRLDALLGELGIGTTPQTTEPRNAA